MDLRDLEGFTIQCQLAVQIDRREPLVRFRRFALKGCCRSVCRLLVSCVYFVIAITSASSRMVAEPNDLSVSSEKSGLIGEYRSVNETVRRIDGRPLLDCRGGVPDQRITAELQDVRWSGIILIREAGIYQFHFSGTGSVAIDINQKTVLNVSSDDLEFISGIPAALEAGEYPVSIVYQRSQHQQSPSSAPAVMNLFWSSEMFTLEPLPSDILMPHAGHEDTSNQPPQAEPTAVDLLRELAAGEQLADAFRCAACHRESSLMDVQKAPALDRVSTNSSAEVLIARLLAPEQVVANSRMPHFDFSTAEAESVAAFLWSISSEGGTAKIADGSETASTEASAQEADVAAGRQLLKTAGCIACHTLPNVSGNSGSGDSQPDTADINPAAWSAYAAPDLRRIAARRSSAWLKKWLQDPGTLNPDHRMPMFRFSDDEIRGIVTALVQDSSEPPAASSNQPQNGENTAVIASAAADRIAAGRELVMSAGCAHCHRIPGIAIPRPSSDQAESLFGLSDRLSENPAGCLREDRTLRILVDSGSQSGNLPDEVSDEVPSSDASAQKLVPRFNLTSRQRGQLKAWFRSGPVRSRQSASETSSSGLSDEVALTAALPLSASARGRILLERYRCLGCHDRDESRGLSSTAAALEASSPSLKGLSQLLIPPALTAVGDKLHVSYLADVISGKRESRRLPWLTVQMPRFVVSDADRQDLTTALLSADRIPDEADAARPEIASAAKAAATTSSELLQGNQLTGAGGFNCVACHAAGSFEPRNVAPGTRGSDLLTMRDRIRDRFFHRWMKNPIRVVPGIEMPALRRAVPGILNDSLSEQLTVVWRALRDPRFTAPTVVSRYEQYLTVGPDEPPRVVRDVFTIGESKKRTSVPRALAVGFNNGHNILLDLSTMQLRQWTFGEFARQRTEGKSWFWSLAGVTAATWPAVDAVQPGKYRMFLRVPTGDPSVKTARLPAVSDEGRMVELISYRTTNDAVELTWRARFAGDDPEAGDKAGDAASGSHSSRSGHTPHNDTAEDPHSALTAWNDPNRPMQSVSVRETLSMVSNSQSSGWQRRLEIVEIPPGGVLELRFSQPGISAEFADAVSLEGCDPSGSATIAAGNSLSLTFSNLSLIPEINPPTLPKLTTTRESVTTVPGFQATRLPISSAIMPTAMTFLSDGRLAFTSLRGEVWIAADTDGDQLEDQLTLFEEGLSAPFGIQAEHDAVLVAHKPEILRLRDTDRDGRADSREVVASGWGISDDYHDWTTGLIRDPQQNLYVGLGSDYSHKSRSIHQDRWRGTVVRISPAGTVSPVAYSFRYPMGLALDAHQRLYATDNQGVQNTFNEINHVVTGMHYGVPSRHDSTRSSDPQTPAVQIPHPWTRSVNSILFLPKEYAKYGIGGHGIGCEYDLKFLIRWTTQDVDGAVQGAVYPFSRPSPVAGGENLIGPISSAVSPTGEIYIGCIWDSGWQGGTNTGAITRLKPLSTSEPQERSENGIREILATPDGFEILFFRPIDAMTAERCESYSLRGYTRVWGGSYATPDSDEHQSPVTAAKLSSDSRSVRLTVPGLRAGFVYDVSLATTMTQAESFWPDRGHYFLKKIPAEGDRFRQTDRLR